MTRRSRGGSATSGALRHTDEIFEALAAGRPIASEDETSRLLRALVADVGLEAPAMFPAVPATRLWAETGWAEAGWTETGWTETAPRPRRQRVRESRGPLRCR